MDEDDLTGLLSAVASGAVAPDDAVQRLRRLPFADLGHARVDHHRALRQGLAEVVYAPGKTGDQVVAIVGELLDDGTGPVLVSRASDELAVEVLRSHPDGERYGTTLVWRAAAPRAGSIVIATAGTADLPVADECAVVLAAHGFSARRLNDVGVAGLHRLLADLDTLLEADVVVVVAGMEGALASVVGGLTAVPVVAVPTSVGYGSSLDGVTALLSMLASCASGIAVMGIDNGFGAAMAALRILAPTAATADRRARDE